MKFSRNSSIFYIFACDPAILPIGTSNYMLINMSNKFDFVQPLIGYVEKKANSFLEENGLGDL